MVPLKLTIKRLSYKKPLTIYTIQLANQIPSVFGARSPFLHQLTVKQNTKKEGKKVY